MPTILGANSVSGYEVSNSIRFNSGDNPKLERTLVAATGEKVFSFSTWVKRSSIGGSQSNYLLYGVDGSSNSFNWYFRNDVLRLYENTAGSGGAYITTNRVFRDTSAWYHVLLVYNTNESTNTNRVKIYINGSQIAVGDLTVNNWPDEDYTNAEVVKNGNTMRVGASGSNSEDFDGYLAETNFIDGIAASPGDFGETNDNGVWIPKRYTATVYGNNGFFFEYKGTGTSANASGMGADTSGETHHFTPTNLAATDITTDTPTNNFATLNPLDNYYAQATFSEGNCKFSAAGSPTTYVRSTQGVTSGKWYWEVKIIDKAGGTSIGVQEGESPGASDQMGYNTAGVQLRQTGQKHTNGGNATYMAAQSNDDIIMIAFDRDNSNVYFGANGQWGDGSGNTDEANPSSAIGITVSDFVFPALGDMDGSGTVVYEINYGNPSFAISSGNADANGYGNFEYAVPSGYYSLCTKNLAEYG